jgi:hypothetical protein
MNANKHLTNAAVPVLCVILTLGVAAWALAQQGVPSQQPPPTTLPPPATAPLQTQPAVQGVPSEGPRANPKAIPALPVAPSSPQARATAGAPNRFARPFVFQSPAAESRFAESSNRLVNMEQRLDQTNQDLIKRLGQARSFTGERQNAALLDLLQQMLLDNAEMHRYLIQSRLAWTGEEAGGLTDPMQTPEVPAQPVPTSPMTNQAQPR